MSAPRLFQVPEAARVRTGAYASTARDGNNGAFLLVSPEPGWVLFCLASDSSDADAIGFDRWEHVSVTARRPRHLARTRVPTWREMCAVKDAFWAPEALVMQLHPRRAEYVNVHPDCLHLWRPLEAAIPSPPAIFVGPLAGPCCTGDR